MLDIGAGYGALTQQVLEEYPNATAVCHDFSEPMLAEARRRLSWAASRLSFVKADLFDPNWADQAGGPFDAVVSAIAIHNVRLPERIRAIYHELYPLVAPGGCFLNYELIAPGGPIVRGLYRRARLREYQARLLAETGQEKSLEEVEQELQRQGRMRASHTSATVTGGPEPATLEHQLRWLREAGFPESECFWKDGQTAIIGAFRAR